MTHIVCQDTLRPFVLFNDCDLTMESISSDDLESATIATDNPFRSLVWSCGIDWYFVVAKDGMYLLNTSSNRGFFCRKKSAAFIEMFLDSKLSKRGGK